MPVEDFTTYIEVEEITDIFSVAANKIDFTDVPSNESSYVYKDFGVGHFGDFEHLVTVYLSSVNIGSAPSFCGYGQKNEITDLVSVTGNALSIRLQGVDTPIYQINCREKVGGAWGDIDFENLPGDTIYYLTISRSGTTYQALIYDDVGRTSLVGTISITCIVTTFRYLMAAESNDFGVNTNRHFSGYIENLDLQEIAIVPLIMQQMDQFNGGTIL